MFNLTADLRGEFTWNTKQLFVYLNVVFETRKNARNQMVMWSSIVEDEVPPPALCLSTCVLAPAAALPQAL